MGNSFLVTKIMIFLVSEIALSLATTMKRDNGTWRRMEYRALQKLAKELLDFCADLWNPNGFPAVGQIHIEVLTEFCANQLDFLSVVETRSIGTII